MGNRILFIVLAISISSCGIFRKKEKEKTLIEVDSTTIKNKTEKSIDTGKILSYRKLTIFNPSVGKKEQNDLTRFFNYPWDLVNATNGLLESTVKLKEQTNNPFQKPSDAGVENNDNQNVAATLEEWSLEKKGINLEKASTEKTKVKKEEKAVKTIAEGNSKTFTILCIVGGFAVVILCIFAFLYWKSRLPKIPEI